MTTAELDTVVILTERIRVLREALENEVRGCKCYWLISGGALDCVCNIDEHNAEIVRVLKETEL